MTNPWNWYQEHVINKLDHDELNDENDIDIPPFYNDSPEMRKHVNRVYNSLNLTDKRIGELLDRLREDELTESTIIFLYGGNTLNVMSCSELILYLEEDRALYYDNMLEWID